jgi:hypothetical protein
MEDTTPADSADAASLLAAALPASPRAAIDGFSARQDVAADPSVMDHISCPPGSTDGASANEPSSHVTTESATAPATADDAESPHRSSKPPKLRIKIRSPKREQHEAKDPANGVQDSSSTPSPSPHHVTGSEITQEGGNWLCTKCINNNAAKRIRCWNCKGWKGGKRENFHPPGCKKAEEDEEELAASILDLEFDEHHNVEMADGHADIPTDTFAHPAGEQGTKASCEDDDDDDLPMMSR